METFSNFLGLTNLGNLAEKAWNYAISFLKKPENKETAKLITDGKQRDTTDNQKDALKAELADVVNSSDFQNFLKNNNISQNSGNNTTVIGNHAKVVGGTITNSDIKIS